MSSWKESLPDRKSQQLSRSKTSMDGKRLSCCHGLLAGAFVRPTGWSSAGVGARAVDPTARAYSSGKGNQDRGRNEAHRQDFTGRGGGAHRSESPRPDLSPQASFVFRCYILRWQTKLKKEAHYESNMYCSWASCHGCSGDRLYSSRFFNRERLPGSAISGSAISAAASLGAVDRNMEEQRSRSTEVQV